MKTSTLPSIRVEPALRSTVESLLADGESLSQFVETAIRSSVQQRQHQHTFIERGLASLAAAEQSQDYVSAEHMLTDLRSRLSKARVKLKQPRA